MPWIRNTGSATSAPSTGASLPADLGQHLVGEPVQDRVHIGHVRDVRPLRVLVSRAAFSRAAASSWRRSAGAGRARWRWPGCSAPSGSLGSAQPVAQVTGRLEGDGAVRRVAATAGPPGSARRPAARPRRSSRACEANTDSTSAVATSGCSGRRAPIAQQTSEEHRAPGVNRRSIAPPSGLRLGLWTSRFFLVLGPEQASHRLRGPLDPVGLLLPRSSFSPTSGSSSVRGRSVAGSCATAGRR